MPGAASTADLLLFAMLCVCGVLFLMVASVWAARPTETALRRYRRPPLVESDVDPHQVLADVAEMVECQTFRAAYNYLRSLSNWFYAHRSSLPPEITTTWMLVQRRLTRIVSLEAYVQDWSEREINLMRGEILTRISALLNPDRSAATGTRVPQSSRLTSAPRPASRSSRRS